MEIKKCPFCGAKADLYQATDGFFVVQCNKCGCGTLHLRSEEEALKRWNKRTPEKKSCGDCRFFIGECLCMKWGHLTGPDRSCMSWEGMLTQSEEGENA